MLLVWAAFALALVELGLRTIGYRRTALWTGAGRAPQSPAQANEVAEAKRLAHLVEIAARNGFYRATCLRQALVLAWLLRRRGIAGQICFGVRKAADTLQAHAWVEVAGVRLNQSALLDQEYTALQSQSPNDGGLPP